MDVLVEDLKIKEKLEDDSKKEINGHINILKKLLFQ